MFDPIKGVEFFAIFASLAITATAIWPYILDRNPQVFGVASIGVVLLVGYCLITSQPAWTAGLSIILTLSLYVIGIKTGGDERERDRKWHLAAIVSAWTSKLIFGLLAGLGSTLTSDGFFMPYWVAVIIIVVALASYVWFKNKTWMSDTYTKAKASYARRQQETTPASTQQ